MAEHRARSLDRAEARPERRVQLRVVARSDEDTGGHQPVPLSAPSVPPPLLSQSSDICGIGRGGWLGAAALYGALIAAFLLIGWRVTPPEPWPPTETVFHVIFEEPAAPAPAPAPPPPEPPASASPDEPPPAPIPEPDPVPPPQLAEPAPVPLPEPAPVPLPEPEPAPQLAEPAPTPVELPRPPRPKPVVKPHAPAAAPVRPPPSAAPAEPQVAVLAPPVAAAPVIPPRPISGLAGNRKPDYPAEARRRGQQGRVMLRVEVSAAGAPLGVTVISSSGHPVLDQAALRAVEQWRFNPATQAGTPVPGVADVPVQFRLED